jgi:hypothetical protein
MTECGKHAQAERAAVEESSCIYGKDLHTRATRRMRHVLVNASRPPIASDATPTDVRDTVGVHTLLGGLACFVPPLDRSPLPSAERVCLRSLSAGEPVIGNHEVFWAAQGGILPVGR